MDSRPWIKAIQINKIRHLEDIDICVCDDKTPRHLLITGPNGSGKTSLLLALREELDYLSKGEETLRKEGGLSLRLHNYNRFPDLIKSKEFVIAYYKDCREAGFKVVQTPKKTKFKYGINENNGSQFLDFLVNLKVQQALAKNEGNQSDADGIEQWFTSFTDVLRLLFDDKDVGLEFNYTDYSFTIVSNMIRFPFTGLSAGYAAALDIVADLIIRMQSINRPKRIFDMPGIALVAEVETHLHLSLQQKILPILTSVFPKVQFIVSTHSPFVLNSISNATIYDLKNRECLQNLSEYSYEAFLEDD